MQIRIARNVKSNVLCSIYTVQNNYLSICQFKMEAFASLKWVQSTLQGRQTRGNGSRLSTNYGTCSAVDLSGIWHLASIPTLALRCLLQDEKHSRNIKHIVYRKVGSNMCCKEMNWVWITIMDLSPFSSLVMKAFIPHMFSPTNSAAQSANYCSTAHLASKQTLPLGFIK